jgi:hypothetical protein
MPLRIRRSSSAPLIDDLGVRGMTSERHRVAIVFPANAKERLSTNVEQSRFADIAKALCATGIEVVGAPYADELVEDVRTRLLGVDGVLVWVNPIQGGHDRSILNAMLADVAARGVFVSAHPEVIDKMGTKEVLYRTRGMSWGCDTRLYANLEAMQVEFPASLLSGAPRVLKQIRGQSGDGVWKVELARTPGQSPSLISLDTALRIRHAARGSAEETMSLKAFLSRCQSYFGAAGGMIDQAYQLRLPDGMVRCYIVRDRVAGFGEQLVNALYPAAPGSPVSEAPQPGPRHYFPPTRSDFQRLKERLEHEWVDELCRLLGLVRSQLPVIWDADFLYGPKDATGADTFVLCEINVSSVYPLPEEALVPLAAETLARIKVNR